MTQSRWRRRLVGAAGLAWGACSRPPVPVAPKAQAPAPVAERSTPALHRPWEQNPVLEDGQTFALDGPDGRAGGRRTTIAEANAAGLVDVDLSDGWAPFILSENDGPPTALRKPHFYRQTYLDLANNRVDPDQLLVAGGPTHALPSEAQVAEQKRREEEARRRHRPLPPRPARAAEPNYLEVFGVPPTLSVLARRMDEDAAKTCYDTVDVGALHAWAGEVTYQSREMAKRQFAEVQTDAAWVAKRLAEWGARDAGVAGTSSGGASMGGSVPDGGVAEASRLQTLAADPKLAARVTRYLTGQRRLRAIRAAQARLVCEGLLARSSRFVDGMFDLPTNEALATFERKNNIFGWGFLSGETVDALTQPPKTLHAQTFRRIITERVVDATAIIEDGSAGGSAGDSTSSASYTDDAGQVHAVPNLVNATVDAFMTALGVTSADDIARLLRTLGEPGRAHFHVAFAAPAKPPYYDPADMDLSVQIDRGDVWYDFPFDAQGRAIEQRREHFPHLTLFVTWHGQKIRLARWRTTIGSWRSELESDGKVYFRYKNSDVGPRIWRDIVSAPVWVPPESTLPKDLLVKKTLDRSVGPLTMVNTEVMGPGFGSAYGLVMAIHHQVTRGGGLFDNQVRTHGSVDYTSIARRFSHGCHRLVNVRAVRMFGFVLRHHAYDRLGSQTLAMRKHFSYEGASYGFEMATRGYLFRLKKPIPVEVWEGRIMGAVKKPITRAVRKPGVDYSSPVLTPAEGTPTPPPVEGAPAVDPEPGP